MAATVKLATVLLLFIAYCRFDVVHCVQFDIWGDLRRTQMIIGSSKVKYAIPFMRRTIEIAFPHDFDTNESFGIVRGIKHSNNLIDEECQPEARLINGGINDRTATIEITSRRGCGIDSLVEFFIEQL